jgi:dihydrofolate reductase
MSVETVAVVAVARNGVIGAANVTPWRLSSDLKRFKALTMGKPLIVGRRTYETFARPLPGRRLIVVTRDPAFAAPDAMRAADPQAALALARRVADEMGAREVVIGGGAEIYRALLDETQRIELTEVELKPQGDAFFPTLDAAQWREIARETPPRGERDEAEFSFVTLTRRHSPP